MSYLFGVSVVLGLIRLMQCFCSRLTSPVPFALRRHATVPPQTCGPLGGDRLSLSLSELVRDDGNVDLDGGQPGPRGVAGPAVAGPVALRGGVAVGAVRLRRARLRTVPVKGGALGRGTRCVLRLGVL